MIIQKILENLPVKGIGLTVAGALFSLGGWGLHAYLDYHSSKDVLNEHTQQIAKLQTGQDRQREALNNINITTTKIDGKIDVLAQQIKDLDSELRRSAR